MFMAIQNDGIGASCGVVAAKNLRRSGAQTDTKVEEASVHNFHPTTTIAPTT
jgi:hypothetical protein